MVESNFTKIPNQVLDNMEKIGIKNNRYLLVLIYIMRHKKGYRLSNKQIENSLSMHHKTVKNAIAFLKDNNIIDYKETSQGKIYGFQKLIKIIKNIENGKSAGGGKSAEGGGKSAEGGGKSAEGGRPYGRAPSAIPPTNNTNYNINYKTNYKTSSVSFEKIRGKIVSKITSFFKNDIDEVAKEIIDGFDPSFYKFQDYIPTDKEISQFLETNKEETLDKFDKYLYNGVVSESFIYNGKLIKPRLALLNTNKVRLNELLHIYYSYDDEEIMEEESIFDKSPTFREFVKQQQLQEKPTKDKYANLPEAEAAYLRALHEYEPPKDDELADVHIKPINSSEYYDGSKEVLATEEDIDEILSEYVSFDETEEDEREMSEREMNELLDEM